MNKNSNKNNEGELKKSISKLDKKKKQAISKKSSSNMTDSNIKDSILNMIYSEVTRLKSIFAKNNINSIDSSDSLLLNKALFFIKNNVNNKKSDNIHFKNDNKNSIEELLEILDGIKDIQRKYENPENDEPIENINNTPKLKKINSRLDKKKNNADKSNKKMIKNNFNDKRKEKNNEDIINKSKFKIYNQEINETDNINLDNMNNAITNKNNLNEGINRTSDKKPNVFNINAVNPYDLNNDLNYEYINIGKNNNINKNRPKSPLKKKKSQEEKIYIVSTDDKQVNNTKVKNIVNEGQNLSYNYNFNNDIQKAEELKKKLDVLASNNKYFERRNQELEDILNDTLKSLEQQRCELQNNENDIELKKKELQKIKTEIKECKKIYQDIIDDIENQNFQIKQNYKEIEDQNTKIETNSKCISEQDLIIKVKNEKIEKKKSLYSGRCGKSIGGITVGHRYV